MPSAPYERRRSGATRVFDATTLPWVATGNPGLRQKIVYRDDARGEFLGLIAFDAFVRSGLHQHQGVATSFVVSGGLTDYHGAIGLNEVGINLRGSTHDAMAYQPTVLVSRLEAPVTYPPEAGPLSGLHAGSRHEAFRNPDPSVAPEINVAIDRVAGVETGIAGLRRQTAFDYAGTGVQRRLLQWTLRPETALPAWHTDEGVELWVRGGEITVDGQRAHANCFVVIEPGARVQVESAFGALLLVWADGPERWEGGDPGRSLFGF
jgi:hypothetical protein